MHRLRGVSTLLPVDFIPYEDLRHQIVQEPCTGCTICYAVCPVDAVISLDDGRATPLLTFEVMERVRTKAFARGPNAVPAPPRRTNGVGHRYGTSTNLTPSAARERANARAKSASSTACR